MVSFILHSARDSELQSPYGSFLYMANGTLSLVLLYKPNKFSGIPCNVREKKKLAGNQCIRKENYKTEECCTSRVVCMQMDMQKPDTPRARWMTNYAH